MSAQTKVYFYVQRQPVVLIESGAASRRYETVYAKELTITKGTNNTLEFAFVNQDQKHVNIENNDITFRILDSQAQQILFQKTLTPIYPVTGITSVRLTAEDIEAIETQRCYYTLEESMGYAVYVDSKGGTRGVLNVVEGTIPEFTPSTVVTLEPHTLPTPPVAPLASVTYNSSVIQTKAVAKNTIQVNLSGFTGNIIIQGSTTDSFTSSYDITTSTLTNSSATYGFEVQGFHPYLRVRVVNFPTVTTNPDSTVTLSHGEVTSILAR
jgi:hypothetical protein